MTIPTAGQVAAAFAAHGWPMPTGLHFVGLRAKGGFTDTFNDMALAMHGGIVAFACRCTTDPGKEHREKPENKEGCAVWAISQVVDGLTFGYHKGEYRCLVPAKPIPVLRYDSLTDATGTPSTSRTTQWHRASPSHESNRVGLWSAGCTVIANPNDFATLMAMADTSGQQRFTVSMLEALD